ncbi:MAG: FkbM family methyltransferase [Coleofasciculus sp. G3-WIS-01]|uniref:FkbM family methyltransferase n=1 Tax=Coleofasciculus sp. G3-WIS-01 TaxID=3069528 RepID=UPI00330331A4
MHIFKYLKSSLFHLIQGDLPEYLKEEWSYYIKRKYYRTKIKRSKWWESQGGKRQELDIKIQPEVKIRLYFDSHLSRIIYEGRFEREERYFINAFLKPGDIFVDIGSNIGLFTVIAGKNVGKMGRVYSFEPAYKNYQRLLKNIELNYLKNVESYQLAISHKKGQMAMNVSLDGFDAWNSIAQPIAGDCFEMETIYSVKWDDFVREHNLQGKVTMMKIDVEGWESYVLSGGWETLSRKDAPVLQVEFTEKASQSANSSCKEVYYKLANLGYQLFTYDSNSRKLIPETLREEYPYVNLIAVKNTEQVFARLQRGKHPRWLR